MRRILILVVALLVGLAGAPSPSAAGSGLPFNLTSAFTHKCAAPENVVVLADCFEHQRSYVQERFPAPGPVTLAGTKFTWPAMDVGVKDTVRTAGQTVTAPAGARGFKTLAVLLAHVSGTPKGTASFTVNYTDGSKVTKTVTAPNWLHGGRDSIITTARTQWIAWAYSSLSWPNEGSVGLGLIPVDKRKTVKSVVLPREDVLVWALSMTNVTTVPKKGPVFQ